VLGDDGLNEQPPWRPEAVQPRSPLADFYWRQPVWRSAAAAGAVLVMFAAVGWYLLRPTSDQSELATSDPEAIALSGATSTLPISTTAPENDERAQALVLDVTTTANDDSADTTETLAAPSSSTSTTKPPTSTTAAPTTAAPTTAYAAPSTAAPTTAAPTTAAPTTAAPTSAAPTTAESTTTTAAPPADDTAAMRQEVLDISNAERAKKGCAALKLDPTLNSVAQDHSRDMVQLGFFAHTNPDGQNAADRFDEAGYPWSAWGENIAFGYSTGVGVMKGWMNSSSHRGNILDCNFNEMGVGIDPGGSNGPYWTQVFGKRG